MALAILGGGLAIASGPQDVAAAGPYNCDTGRTSNWESYGFDGWAYPQTLNFPYSGNGTEGTGTGDTQIGGVYSTITTYPNYINESPSNTPDSDFDYVWVMLSNDLSNNPSQNSGEGDATFAQVGPMTYPDGEQYVQVAWTDGVDNTNSEEIPSLGELSSGSSEQYKVLYNYFGGDEMSFWYNGTVIPIGGTPNSDGPEFSDDSTQAEEFGETHSIADSMFGDSIDNETFTGSWLYKGSWERFDTGNQATIGSTGTQDPTTATVDDWGPINQYGWLKSNSDGSDFNIWDIGCPTSITNANNTMGYSTSPVLTSNDGPAETLESDSGDYGPYSLEAQADGAGLVLYNGAGQALWSPEAGAASSYLVDQEDGNLVWYNGAGESALWNSGTSGDGTGSYLVMQPDGNLVLFNSSGSPTWQTSTNWASTDSDLMYGTTLSAGSQINSATDQYFLSMQTDCNLVLYKNTSPTPTAEWNSGTSGDGSGCFLSMQTDGNLVVYNASDVAKWNSGTNGTGTLNHMVVNEAGSNAGTFTVSTVGQVGASYVWRS